MELERKRGLLGQLAAWFVDYRDPALIEHMVEELIKRRVFGLGLGYEDLDDHDHLRERRCSPCWSAKPDPTGQ
jgi:hypothetical protein